MERGYFISTVSELNRGLASCLEVNFPRMLKVKGEAADVKIARNGHIYFDLVEGDSALKVVCWQSKRNLLKFMPQIGDEIIAIGKIGFYPKGSQVNFVLEQVEKYGEGDIKAQIEILKKQLKQEGLFDRKRNIAKFIKNIAIITSDKGAVLHDVMRTISERFPCNLFLYSVAVQGDTAHIQTAEAIAKINGLVEEGLYQIDVIMLVRGGGSFTDLLPFNTEQVARAIYSSKIPLITGIGHEPDITIADLVADKSLATPTAAALFVTPHSLQDLRIKLTQYEEYIRRATDNILKQLIKDIIIANNRLENIFAKQINHSIKRLFTVNLRLENIANILIGNLTYVNNRLIKLNFLLINDLKNKQHRLAEPVKELAEKLRYKLTSQLISIDQKVKHLAKFILHFNASMVDYHRIYRRLALRATYEYEKYRKRLRYIGFALSYLDITKQLARSMNWGMVSIYGYIDGDESAINDDVLENKGVPIYSAKEVLQFARVKVKFMDGDIWLYPNR